MRLSSVQRKRSAVQIQAELQASGFAHATRMPWRIEHYLDIEPFDGWKTCQPALNVGFEDIRHAAARRGHGHFDINLVAAFGRRDVAFVDKPQIDDVDRN